MGRLPDAIRRRARRGGSEQARSPAAGAGGVDSFPSDAASLRDLGRGQRTAQVRKCPARAEQHGRCVVHVAHQERALRQVRHRRFELRLVHATGRIAAEQAFDHARLVALRLQAADEPGAGVAQALVVEVDGILRRQHDAEAERARLLHQRQHRQLGRRHRARREEAEHFIHVEDRAQAGGAGLAAHPRDELVRDQRHDEHAFGVVQVRDRDDRDARLAVRVVEQRLDVERVAGEPGLEPGRCQQAVDAERELRAVLRREEALDVEDAHLVERRLLHRPDQGGEVEALALAPRGVEQGGEQDEFATADRIGVDAEQSEQAGDGRADTLLERGGVVRDHGIGRCKRTEDRQRPASVRAGRVDVHDGRVTQALNALAVLAPLLESLAPGRCGCRRELVDALALARGFAGVDPGLEVFRPQLRKGQCEVGDVAFRVDDDGGNAVDRGLLEQRHAEAGLAAAGHADADRMRRQVARVVQQFVAELLRGRVVLPAEVEDAELFVGRERHVGFLGSGSAPTARWTR